ncbi:imidazole glycerol phosphate synthase subunit HisH [Candidatus Pelagibacter ubique]|jgi:imidazole glycerol-phosphate synthase subunit HisH|nr:imidazole glycerol phosphate synthase subunit HisH [Candidatus Pelagibacter ubique]
MCEKKPIGIIDYGSGNLQSIVNALNYLKIPNKIVNDSNDLHLFSKAILPGVGSFEYGMKNLAQTSFSNSILELVKSQKISILGICLGMQLLYESSEEDNGCKGLGIIPGKVKRIKNKNDIRVPNIGWRKIVNSNKSMLLKEVEIEPIFYFVHSYACEALNKKAVTGILNYGESYDAIIETDYVYGTQFHPEKSQAAGLKVLKNFSQII